MNNKQPMELSELRKSSVCAEVAALVTEEDKCCVSRAWVTLSVAYQKRVFRTLKSRAASWRFWMEMAVDGKQRAHHLNQAKESLSILDPEGLTASSPPWDKLLPLWVTREMVPCWVRRLRPLEKTLSSNNSLLAPPHSWQCSINSKFKKRSLMN